MRREHITEYNYIEWLKSLGCIMYLPSNWSTQGTGITVGKNRTQYFYSSQYYMKEVYLFNKALDLTTIRKIQGYE